MLAEIQLDYCFNILSSQKCVKLQMEHIRKKNCRAENHHACRVSSRTSSEHDISSQKCTNFIKSEFHLEHVRRPPGCSPSDSQCIWNILGRKILEPEIIIFAIFFSITSRASLVSFSRSRQPQGPMLQGNEDTHPIYGRKISRAEIN